MNQREQEDHLQWLESVKERAEYEKQLIIQWLKDGILNNPLTMAASLASVRTEYDNSTIAEPFRQLYAIFAKELAEIKSQYDLIDNAAKLWEIKHWFNGKAKVMTNMELQERMFDSMKDDYVKQKPEGLQKFVRESKYAAFSSKHAEYKAMMLASAGRVLITINGGEKFHNCSVTIILDETADWPRGGIQHVDGKVDDIVALINFSTEILPEFKHDKDVGFGF